MTERTETLSALVQKWHSDACRLEEAAAEPGISDEEHSLNLYIARQLRQCIGELDAVITSELESKNPPPDTPIDRSPQSWWKT